MGQEGVLWTGPALLPAQWETIKILVSSEACRCLILMQLMLTWGRFGEISTYELPSPTSLYSQQVIKKPNEFRGQYQIQCLSLGNPQTALKHSKNTGEGVLRDS